jgi:hypothetical protein
MVACEFVALLLTVTLPVIPATVAGVKVTSSVTVCPGVRICPVETPLAVNPGPEMLIFETVTLETFDPPGFDRMTDRETALPMATDPKLTDEAEIEMEAAAGGVVGDCWADLPVAFVRPVQPGIESIPRMSRR